MKPQYKWASVTFLLISFMQDNNLLPVITDKELEKLYQLLLWDTHFISNSFNYGKPPFYFLKLPAECLEKIKSVNRFQNRPRKQYWNAGQVLVEFLRFIVNDLSNPQHPSRQHPIRIINRVDINQVNLTNPVRNHFIFWVQSLFSEQMLSLMASNLNPG